MPDTKAAPLWGGTWQGVAKDDPLQGLLLAETGPPHPLAELQLEASGRCTVCDDVLATPTAGLAHPEMYVVHLTGHGRPGRRGDAWQPSYVRLRGDEFIRRFLAGCEHL